MPICRAARASNLSVVTMSCRCAKAIARCNASRYAMIQALSARRNSSMVARRPARPPLREARNAVKSGSRPRTPWTTPVSSATFRPRRVILTGVPRPALSISCTNFCRASLILTVFMTTDPTGVLFKCTRPRTAGAWNRQPRTPGASATLNLAKRHANFLNVAPIGRSA